MKEFNQRKKSPTNFVVISTRPLLAGIFLFYLARAVAQSSAGLTISPYGTNQFSVTITNLIGTNDYDLQWIPALTSTNWAYAAIGVPGGTNFVVDADTYSATFFRVVLDNNAVPLWEAANPSITNSPLLNVIIASPANGANLSQ